MHNAGTVATITQPTKVLLSSIIAGFICDNKSRNFSKKQVAQWATIAYLGASIMFGDTIIYDTQRQVTMNLKQ